MSGKTKSGATRPSALAAAPSKAHADRDGDSGSRDVRVEVADPDALCGAQFDRVCKSGGFCLLGWSTFVCVAMLGAFVGVLLLSDVPLLKKQRSDEGCGPWPEGCNP